MALTPLVRKDATQGTNGESNDRLYGYIQDYTGVYNATTNTGGYGAPNPLYTDVLKSYLFFSNLFDTTTNLVTLTTLTTPTAIQFANPTTTYYYPMSSISTGQSTSEEELTDGIYKVDYYPSFQIGVDNSLEATFTNGSTSMVFTTGTPTLTNYTYVYAPDGEFYAIDSWDGGTSTFTLAREYEGATVTLNFSFSLCYYASAYFSILNGLVECVQENFVAVAEACCNDCLSKDLKKALDSFTLLNGVDAVLGCGEYAKSQRIVDLLTDSCNDTDDCNCG